MSSPIEERPLPYDLTQSMIPMADAAELAGIAVPVIYNWIKRGYRARDKTWRHLPAYRGADGRWYVNPVQLQRAEAATRPRARREIGYG